MPQVAGGWLRERRAAEGKQEALTTSSLVMSQTAEGVPRASLILRMSRGLLWQRQTGRLLKHTTKQMSLLQHKAAKRADSSPYSSSDTPTVLRLDTHYVVNLHSLSTTQL